MCVVPDSGKVIRIDTCLHGAIANVNAIVTPFIGAPIAVTAAAEGDPDTDNIRFTTGTTAHGMQVGDWVTNWEDFSDTAYEGPFAVAVVPTTLTYEVVGVWTATGTGTMVRGITLPGPAGAITVAYSGSAKGDIDTVYPIANNEVLAGDIIGIHTDGGSTNAVKLTVTFVIDR